MRYFRMIVVAAIVLGSYQASGQHNYAASLSNFENQYQKCLDEGDDRMRCSREYYQQLDGLLQSILKDMRTTLKVSQRTAFRNEQTAWNQKKEAYFRKLPKTVKADNEDAKGAELQMMILDKKSEFLVERINELAGGR